MRLLLRDERVDHDGDEEVEEDLWDDYLEADEVEAGRDGGAAPVGYAAVVICNGLVGGILITLELDSATTGRVEH